ncbi:putative Major facilitator superfamily (MFS) profile domain-containing protein [Seiridium cardinale]
MSTQRGNNSARFHLFKTRSLPLLGVLMAMIYGSISNSKGRRFIIRLALMGQILALFWTILVGEYSLLHDILSMVSFLFLGYFGSGMPVELLLLSSLFLFVGGGIRVELSMLYTSFSDAIAWQNRTQLLSLMHASDAIAGLLAYPISSALMQYQLWAPFGLAVLVFILRYAVLSYMPESSPYFDQNATEADILLNPYEARRWEDREGDQSSLVPPKSLTTDAGRGLGSLFTAMRSSSLWSFFKHRGPNAIFGCFIGKRIAFSSEGFISQYASEILHKNISQTYWLRTFNYAGMLIVLGVILPLLSRCLANPTNELVVVRGSLVDLMVGFTILWRGRSLVALSTGLFICGFGEGLEVGLQSLGSYLVGEAHHATFFSFVSVLGVFGELLGGPVMAGVYAVRGQDSLPMGYCFLLSMVLFGGLLLASFLIQSSQVNQ